MLVPPFDAADVERFAATLSRFLPHTVPSAIALTGGVAIEMHCHDAGSSSGTQIADVDFVATSVEAIASSVASSLLVSHFHLPHPGYPKFMVQVVDRTRASASMCSPTWWARSRRQRNGALLGGMASASAERPIDQKHQRDAMTLGLLCGRRIVVAPRRRVFEILGYN